MNKADRVYYLSGIRDDLIALQKPQYLIPLKKSEMQGAKFSRNEA